MTRQAIAVWEDEFVKISATDNLTNSPDFDPPIYNVWKQDIPPRARGSTGSETINYQLLVIFAQPYKSGANDF